MRRSLEHNLLKNAVLGLVIVLVGGAFALLVMREGSGINVAATPSRAIGSVQDLASGTPSKGDVHVLVRRPMGEEVVLKSQGPVCDLSVVTREGGPVEGAQVHISDGWQALGRTDPQGILVPPLASSQEMILHVRADGFVPRVVGTPFPLPEKMVVRLDHAWTLRGQVVDLHEEAVGPGILVLALDSSESLSVERIRASLSGDGPISIARTSRNGEFEFNELDPSAVYNFYAGGQGLCSVDPFATRVGIESSAHIYVITVKPVYGVVVGLRELGGGPLRLGSQLQGRWLGTPVATAKNARPVMSGSWTALMLGLDPRMAPTGSTADRCFYFTTGMDHGEAIDLTYDASLPGYEHISVQLKAKKASGQLHSEIAEAAPLASGFGELTVWLEPVVDIENIFLPETGGACPGLVLVDLQGGDPMKVVLSELEDGLQTISGIPFGTYSVQFRASHQLFRYPKHEDGPVLITVGTSKAYFQVPLGDLGALQLSVVGSDGLRFCGTLSGTHARVAGGETDAFYFPAPPYSFSFLPRGDYTLSVFAEGQELKGVFSIVQGEVSHLELLQRD